MARTSGIPRMRRPSYNTGGNGFLYGVYKTIHKARYPGVVMVSPRTFKNPQARMQAFETALGIGSKRKGVVHSVRGAQRKGFFGGF